LTGVSHRSGTRSGLTRPLLLLAAVMLAAPTLCRAQTVPALCAAASSTATPGVVWQGHEHLRLRELAGLLAPMLWFSGDEPLLAEGRPPIPAAHPCDAHADHPVVYYQVSDITYRGSTPVSRPEEDDPTFSDTVESFILKYYFYYPEDIGVGGHPHDLEAVEFEVWLEGDGECRRVRLASVEALAHGSRWYSNILKVRSDTRYPLALFVEEGKHGSAPDRNADGTFMRGYDITERVNDAWGVRDSLGQGVLLSSGYASEMTKPRTQAFRLLPPDSPLLQVTPRQRSYHDGEPSLGRYQLRAGNTVAACAAIAPERERLVRIMQEQRFGLDQPPGQHEVGSVNRALSDLSLPDSWLSASLRVTNRRLGAAFIFKGLDLRQGWIVPRVTVSDRDATGEALFTPSASRWADYYFSGGVRRQFVTTRETRTIDTEQGRREVEILVPPNWDFVVETGVKFRAQIPRKMRPFMLGYSFGGMRFGLQALGFSHVDEFRFIWEIGAGAW
jgi:hypothetical protein